MQTNFPTETSEKRLTATRALLCAWRVDALYVTGESNRRWLSGFDGSNGQLLITQTQAILATDFRYCQQATQQAPAFALFKHQRTPESTAELFKQAQAQTIALEASHLTLRQAAELRQNKELAGIAWVELAETIEPLRALKDEAELAAIQAAAAITDAVMARVNDLAQAGMSERTLAWELEKELRAAGADGLAFPIIVASGPNSALPHHRAGQRPLQTGDVLVVDMGVRLNGYHSDLTRTFYLGKAPPAEFWRVYDLALAAHTAVFQQAHPGLTAAAVDALARNVIKDAGYGEQFGHGLGHGVGLEIHEAPFLSSRSGGTAVLSGMTATIEPGIYLPEWGGIRIEDLAYFTADRLLPLSQCPKEPIIG